MWVAPPGPCTSSACPRILPCSPHLPPFLLSAHQTTGLKELHFTSLPRRAGRVHTSDSDVELSKAGRFQTKTEQIAIPGHPQPQCVPAA